MNHSRNCLKTGDNSKCLVCMRITINILKQVAEGQLKINEFYFQTIQKAKLTIDELFKEAGRQVGNYGIINEGCLAIEKALAKPVIKNKDWKWIYGEGQGELNK